MTDTSPVTISIVGTGTGDGGGMAPTPNGTIAVTPGQQPDLRINVVTPVIAIMVRFLHLFLVSFSGAIGANELGIIDIGGLTPKLAIALSAAGVGSIKDLITVFGRLEGKYPLISGSI
jgi:hypothetical protein